MTGQLSTRALLTTYTAYVIAPALLIMLLISAVQWSNNVLHGLALALLLVSALLMGIGLVATVCIMSPLVAQSLRQRAVHLPFIAIITLSAVFGVSLLMSAHYLVNDIIIPTF